MSSEMHRLSHRIPGLQAGVSLRLRSYREKTRSRPPSHFLVVGGLLVVAEGRSPAASAKAEPGTPSPEAAERERQLAEQARLLRGAPALERRERGRGPPGVDHLRGQGHREEAPADPEAPDAHARRRQGPAFDAAAELAGTRARARRRRVLLRRRGRAGPAVGDGRPARKSPPEGLEPIVELPPEEYEAVTPAPSRIRLSFEEKSEGLPKSGFWRSNMAVADLDGDGRPEIVDDAPAPRGGRVPDLPVRRARWRPSSPSSTSEEGLGFALRRGRRRRPERRREAGRSRRSVTGPVPSSLSTRGGTASGSRSRGLPTEMSGRAVAAGDLDGDGKVDVIALSDEPEASRMKGPGQQLKPPASGPEGPRAGALRERPRPPRLPRLSGRPLRARISRASSGPASATASSRGGPGTRRRAALLRLGLPAVSGGRAVVYEWDRAARSFRSFGAWTLSSATASTSERRRGPTRGKPAAFVVLRQGEPRGGRRQVDERPRRLHLLPGRDGLEEEAAHQGPRGEGRNRVQGPRNRATSTETACDDVVWADDSTGRVRVFFQTARGEFEELGPRPPARAS